jgi:hypothetical protein
MARLLELGLQLPASHNRITFAPLESSDMKAFIKMFPGQKPPDDPNAYDARETIKYLGPELRIAER